MTDCSVNGNTTVCVYVVSFSYFLCVWCMKGIQRCFRWIVQVLYDRMRCEWWLYTGEGRKRQQRDYFLARDWLVAAWRHWKKWIVVCSLCEDFFVSYLSCIVCLLKFDSFFALYNRKFTLFLIRGVVLFVYWNLTDVLHCITENRVLQLSIQFGHY